jgi:hypothetical protein
MKHLLLKSLVMATGIFQVGVGHAALSIFADANGDSSYDSILNVTPGAIFKLTVFAAEDGLHGGLTSYALEVGLDAGLSVSGANDAAKLASLVSHVQWDLPDSKSLAPLEVVDGSFFNNYSGTVQLFEMNLQAPGASGTYNVSFKNVEPDDTFDGFVGFDGFVYDATNIFQSTQIHVVPVPGALPLFASALVGLGWNIRRRRPQ